MSIIYMKAKNNYTDDSAKLKQEYRLNTMLMGWLNAQLTLKREWERFQSSIGNKAVPYRLWSRYGAYLDAHMNDRKH